MLYSLRCRRGRRGGREELSVPVLRGNMRSVLVVPAPTPIFAQAVFILRDDYFSTPGLSHQELMRQAKSAANIYCGSFAPPHPRRIPIALISAASSSALTILVLKIAQWL